MVIFWMGLDDRTIHEAPFWTLSSFWSWHKTANKRKPFECLCLAALTFGFLNKSIKSIKQKYDLQVTLESEDSEVALAQN